MKVGATYIDEALPEMDPVIAHEETSYGWRGLTRQGEIIEVRGTNDHKAHVPAEIIVAHHGNGYQSPPLTL